LLGYPKRRASGSRSEFPDLSDGLPFDWLSKPLTNLFDLTPQIAVAAYYRRRSVKLSDASLLLKDLADGGSSRRSKLLRPILSPSHLAVT
jgi:hypothetical protein